MNLGYDMENALFFNPTGLFYKLLLIFKIISQKIMYKILKK